MTVWTSIAQQVFCSSVNERISGIISLSPPTQTTALQQVTSARLCVFSVLCVHANGVALAGPDCRSWGLPCRHTSGRSIINVGGNQHYDFVDSANQMVARFLPYELMKLMKIGVELGCGWMWVKSFFFIIGTY